MTLQPAPTPLNSRHTASGGRRPPRTVALFLAFLAAAPAAAAGQELPPSQPGDALRVYLECAARGCDTDHFRQEVAFVHWVRDVRDAEVHLLITSQGSGSGTEYVLDFLGRGSLVGREDQLRLASSSTDTDDERIQGLTGVIAVGLARFAVLAGRGGAFTVTPAGAGDEHPPARQGPVDDPWDYWVFRVSGDVEYDGEESERSRDLGASFSVDRTTEQWNIAIVGRGSLVRNEFDLDADSTIVDERDDWFAQARVFYSLAERWSAGLEAGGNSSTRNNTRVGGQVGAGVEFSFFPYEEWTRRRMTLQALLYLRYFDYDDTTIYGKDTERVWESNLRWSLGFRQPWGTANLNASAAAFLHDPGKFYRLSAGGHLSVRIVRGLEWNLSGDVSQIRDQIFLSAARLSPEEVLLRRRQLPTDYSFEFSTGFSFTFGSIYNNVVNNRFGGTGGRRRF